MLFPSTAKLAAIGAVMPARDDSSAFDATGGDSFELGKAGDVTSDALAMLLLGIADGAATSEPDALSRGAAPKGDGALLLIGGYPLEEVPADVVALLDIADGIEAAPNGVGALLLIGGYPPEEALADVAAAKLLFEGVDGAAPNGVGALLLIGGYPELAAAAAATAAAVATTGDAGLAVPNGVGALLLMGGYPPKDDLTAEGAGAVPNGVGALELIGGYPPEDEADGAAS